MTKLFIKKIFSSISQQASAKHSNVFALRLLRVVN